MCCVRYSWAANCSPKGSWFWTKCLIASHGTLGGGLEERKTFYRDTVFLSYYRRTKTMDPKDRGISPGSSCWEKEDSREGLRKRKSPRKRLPTILTPRLISSPGWGRSPENEGEREHTLCRSTDPQLSVETSISSHQDLEDVLGLFIPLRNVCGHTE